MAPAPRLQDLIDTVRQDAGVEDPLLQLRQASAVVAEIEEVSDSLLGHFVDRCRRSGRSWSEISSVLGVSKQAAHKRYALPPVTFERFTERARAVLRAARTQARELGHTSTGSVHLLLGMLAPSEGVAAQVLADMGITATEIVGLLGGGAPGSPTAAPGAGAAATDAEEGDEPSATGPPFAADAQVALRGALMAALHLGHNYIGTEHLLLGLLSDDDGPAAVLLASVGAFHDEVRRRVEQKLAGFRP